MPLLNKITKKQYHDLALSDKKPTILYGAGYEGKKLCKLLKKQGIDVRYFCDRDPNKQGTEREGIAIITPADLVKMRISFRMIIAIYSVCFPMEEITEFINQAILQPLQGYAVSCEVYELVDYKAVFESVAEYRGASHWFDPLCYSMAEYFTPEYAVSLRKCQAVLYIKNGILKFEDISGKYLNIKDGVRKTVGSPQNAERSVYFIGDSRAFCTEVEDKHTIESFLQGMLGNQYIVINMGTKQFTLDSFYNQIRQILLKPGDLVFFSYVLSFVTCARDEFVLTESESTALFTHYLRKMQMYCMEQGAGFLYYYIPEVSELQNPSDIERYFDTVFIKHYEEPPASKIGHVAFNRLSAQIKSFPISKQEAFEMLHYQAVPALDLTDYFSRPHNFGEVFVDRRHMSPNGNQAVAQKLLQVVRYMELLNDSREKLTRLCTLHEAGFVKELIKAYECRELSEYLEYLQGKQARLSGIAGCVVMNCNPFTNGHRYLIECAARQVDML